MSKNVKTLLYIGIFVLCMALVLLVLVLTAPKDTSEDTNVTETTTISLVAHERDDLKKVTVSNAEGGFVLTQGAKGLCIPALDGFKTTTTTINAAGNCIATINAQQLVEENAKDLSKYGLAEDNYEAKVEVELQSGEIYTVYYGKFTPDGANVYIRLGDSSNVYTALANSSRYFYYNQNEYISLIIMEELSQTNTAPTIDFLTITRKDLDYDIIFEDDTKNYSADEISMASSQVMISPVYAYLDITHSNDIVYGLWGLTATQAVKPFPTEEDFAEYGLDDPFCTVKLEAELQVYELMIGDVASYGYDEAGNPTTEPALYYGYFKGIDCIFTFATSEVPWTYFMPIDVLSSMMTSNYIYALDYIDIQLHNTEDISYYFDLEGNIDEATLSGKLGPNEINVEDFKILYQFMLKCPIDALCLEEPASDAKLLATIEFARASGGGDTLEFYDAGNNRVIIKLNGTTSFSQPRSYLNVLESNLALFASGAPADELQEVW